MRGSYKDIIRIALPIILGGVAQTSISVADTAMMGRVGTIEVAAIGYVSVYYLMLFMIGFSYTKGTQILAARRMGEGDLKAGGSIFDNSMLAILVQAIVLCLTLRFGSDYLLDLLVEDRQIYTASVQYLEMRSWGIIFSFIGSVFLAYYMSIGHMMVLLFGVIAMSAINILLNWILIFGMWGAPEMGIEGAALASNIAEAMAATIFTVYAVARGMHHKYGMFNWRNISGKVIGLVTSISAPIVLQTLLGLLGWMFFFYYIEKMGPTETAVSSIAKNIYMFFGLFAWGFATSANTIISNLIGQQKMRMVMPAIKKILILSLGVSAVVSIPLGIFAEQVVDIVYSPTAEVLQASVPVTYITIIALWVYAISMVLYHAVTSTGSVKASLLIEVITVLIYVLYIQMIFNIDGVSLPIVWTCEIFYWLLMAGLSAYYIRTGHWKKVKI